MEHWTRTHSEPTLLHQVGVEIYIRHQGKICPSNNRRVNIFWSGSGVRTDESADEGASEEKGLDDDDEVEV